MACFCPVVMQENALAGRKGWQIHSPLQGSRMRFRRFTLRAGKIHSQSDRVTEKLDPALLDGAMETLTLLRVSATGDPVPLPGVATCWIGLGLPNWRPAEAGVEETTARPRWERYAREARRTDFYLMRDDGLVLFQVVPATAIENDPALFGTIAGSAAGAQVRLPRWCWWRRDRRTNDQQIAETKAVAAEIWKARPALVSHLPDTHPLSAFVDCFAAALLSNPEAPDGESRV